MKRWIDDIGVHLPTPEEMLRQLLALAPATECHLDGYYPLGTDHCVMVVKDEHDRILIPHEAAAENGDEARQFLQRCKDLGLNVTAAFSDYSQSFTEAINPTTLSRFDMTVGTPYALLAYHAPYQEVVYVTSVSDGRRRVYDSHL
jgi:hypothetical protein